MRGGQEVAVKAGRAHAFHRDGEAISWWQRRHQGGLQLGLREELLPVLQVGRVHLQEGRAARVPGLQHGCPLASERRESRQSDMHQRQTSGKKRLEPMKLSISESLSQTQNPN